MTANSSTNTDASPLESALNSTVHLTWSIFAVSVLFAVAGAISLLFASILSLVSLPDLMASFAKDIASSEDISVVKKVCLLLASIEDGERAGRLHFMWWGLGLVVLLGVACAGLSARLLFLLHHQSAQALNTASEPLSPFRRFLSCAVGGKLKLWQAFWLLYFPVPAILYVAFGATLGALRTFGQMQGSYLLQFVAFPLSLSLVYLAFIGVSVIVWRCSQNTQHRVWTYGARIFVILNIALPLLKLVIVWLQIWPKG